PGDTAVGGVGPSRQPALRRHDFALAARRVPPDALGPGASGSAGSRAFRAERPIDRGEVFAVRDEVRKERRRPYRLPNLWRRPARYRADPGNDLACGTLLGTADHGLRTEKAHL